MQNRSHRTLLAALTGSLLIHAVLLSGPAWVVRTRLETPQRAINALIVGLAAGDSANVAAAPDRPATGDWPGRRNASADPVLLSPPTVAASSDRARPMSTGNRTAVRGRGAAPLTAPRARAPAGGSGRMATATGAAPDRAPDVADEGLSADALRQYRVAVASAARRFLRDTESVGEQRGQGTVEIALDVSALVAAPAVTVLRSSGDDTLDALALAMLTRAAQATPVPGELRARHFRIVLPVRFASDTDQ